MGVVMSWVSFQFRATVHPLTKPHTPYHVVHIVVTNAPKYSVVTKEVGAKSFIFCEVFWMVSLSPMQLPRIEWNCHALTSWTAKKQLRTTEPMVLSDTLLHAKLYCNDNFFTAPAIHCSFQLRPNWVRNSSRASTVMLKTVMLPRWELVF